MLAAYFLHLETPGLPACFPLIVKAMVSPAVMYGCEKWIVKKAEHRRIDAFELRFWRRLLSPQDRKKIKRVNLKGNQPLILLGRTDTEAEASILLSPDVKSWLIGKDPKGGKDWRLKSATEDEMVGWHHWFNGQELGQTPGDGKGQGGLVCCSPWGLEKSDLATEQRYLCIHIHTHTSVAGHLGYLHFLAVMNNAAMKYSYKYI